MVAALLKEMGLRQNYLEGEALETIYFGGGTPSLLSSGDLNSLYREINRLFKVSANAETTIEANPDDINGESLRAWKQLGFNRLSIGVQSFFDEDLQWMNRAHNATEAKQSVMLAKEFFDNITIDLIYGLPGLTHEKWQQNVETAIAMDVPHLSCYALTVEPKTNLFRMINEGGAINVDNGHQSDQFLLLMRWLEEAGFEHYEISSFAKTGFRSRHNSAYWQQKKYLGIGPSAHSFDGHSRQWNINNNNAYIESIDAGRLPIEKEVLTENQRLNEYIMTSLRTAEGLDLSIAPAQKPRLELVAAKYIGSGLMISDNGFLRLTKEGKLLADGISAALFV